MKESIDYDDIRREFLADYDVPDAAYGSISGSCAKAELAAGRCVMRSACGVMGLAG